MPNREEIPLHPRFIQLCSSDRTLAKVENGSQEVTSSSFDLLRRSTSNIDNEDCEARQSGRGDDGIYSKEEPPARLAICNLYFISTEEAQIYFFSMQRLRQKAEQRGNTSSPEANFFR